MTKSLAYRHKRHVIAHWLQDFTGETDTITRHWIDAET